EMMRLGIFVGMVTDAVAARDEDHAGRAYGRDEARIMERARRQTRDGMAECTGALLHERNDRLGEPIRRIGGRFDNLGLARPDGACHHLGYPVAEARQGVEIRMTEVDREDHALRYRVR